MISPWSWPIRGARVRLVQSKNPQNTSLNIFFLKKKEEQDRRNQTEKIETIQSINIFKWEIFPFLLNKSICSDIVGWRRLPPSLLTGSQFLRGSKGPSPERWLMTGVWVHHGTPICYTHFPSHPSFPPPGGKSGP